MTIPDNERDRRKRGDDNVCLKTIFLFKNVD